MNYIKEDKLRRAMIANIILLDEAQGSLSEIINKQYEEYSKQRQVEAINLIDKIEYLSDEIRGGLNQLKEDANSNKETQYSYEKGEE